MDTFLGLFVHSCIGEGGTPQTNTIGICGEYSQCLGHTGFAPAHGVCAFPVYTAQALGCSARNCLRWALGCMPFRDLSPSGSGSRILHRLDWACILCPSQVRAAQVLGEHSRPQLGLCLIASPVPAAQFSGCTKGLPSQVCLCLSWGADLWLRPSWQMLTVQNPKKSRLAMKPSCSLVEDASLGMQLSPSVSGCPRLPVSSRG